MTTLTPADRLAQFRMAGRAMTYQVEQAKDRETEDHDDEMIVALRLVRSEVASRDWPEELRGEADALIAEIDEAVADEMRRRWSYDDRIDVDFLLCSWLMRRGPRRFYSHNVSD